MTDTPAEPRMLFPLVVFNRPRLGGLTAGQKEGLIPKDAASILPKDKVTDFRAKVIASDAELPESTAPAGDDKTGEDGDPKAVVSSVTGNASPSEGESSESTTPTTQTPASTENPTSQSEQQGDPADAERVALQAMPRHLLPRMIGEAVPPAETTGEIPAAS